MSSVNGVNQTQTTTTTTQKSSELGKEDFLKLLVTQMKNQDPLDPVKNEDFIAQLAQFNSLEQMINLNKNFEQLNTLQTLTQSASLIGKAVAWNDEDGKTQLGVVSAIEMQDGVPMLVVDDMMIDISKILAISNAVV